MGFWVHPIMIIVIIVIIIGIICNTIFVWKERNSEFHLFWGTLYQNDRENMRRPFIYIHLMVANGWWVIYIFLWCKDYWMLLKSYWELRKSNIAISQILPWSPKSKRCNSISVCSLPPHQLIPPPKKKNKKKHRPWEHGQKQNEHTACYHCFCLQPQVICANAGPSDSLRENSCRPRRSVL